MRLVRAQLFCDEGRIDGQTDRQTNMAILRVVFVRRLAKTLKSFPSSVEILTKHL
jgi:hypothetical protein